MLRFAANLSMMYNEHDFLDRFAAAAADGFPGVEYLFPYDYPADEIRRRLDDAGLAQALFNGPPGNWAAGERGTASLPGREEEFRRSIATQLCMKFKNFIHLRPDFHVGGKGGEGILENH